MGKKCFLLALVTMLLPLLAIAETVEIDGIMYNLSDGYAEVVRNPNGYSGDIVIPDEVSYGGRSYIIKSIEGHSAFKESGPVQTGIVVHEAAFENCTDLISVTIGDNVETIGAGAFSGCSGLRTVSFGKNTKTIFQKYSFTYYSTIGDHVSSSNYIDICPFEGCDNISDIYCYADKSPSFVVFEHPTVYYQKDIYPSSENRNFNLLSSDDAYSKATLHVHDYAVEYYKNNNTWGRFGKIVVFAKNTDFKLTYYVDRKEYKSYKYKYDDAITPEEYPVREGSTFSGWGDIPSNMPGKDVDVYGSFTLNRHKLIFMIDGSEYKTVEMPYGELLVYNSEFLYGGYYPYKENYEFLGWGDVPETMPDSDVVLTGSYKKVSTDIDGIKYKFNGKEAYVCKVIEKRENVVIVSPFEDDGITYTVTSINENVFKNNLKVCSVSIPDDVMYINNGCFEGCKNLKTLELGGGIAFIGERAFAGIDKLTDVTIRAEDIPETDRTAFENSYIEDYVTLHVPGSSINKYKEAAPWKNFKDIVAIEGTETVQTYKLTYMVDGVVYETFDVNEGESITPESEPTKEGYTFSGWSEIPSTMPGENVTVYGTFTVNKYKLIYMIDGTEYKTIEVEYGSTITPEDNPTMDGYTFSGWSDIPDTMPASDIVVTGSFTKGTYTLTYVLDGVEYKTYTYGYDESITPESVPDKEGYTFTGWDNLPNTMPGHDVTVSGSYTINKYNLIYMVDGEVYMTIEVEYGASITPEEEPTKDGYVFSGWSWIPSKMPAEDVTVSGTFKQIGYNVSDNIYIIDGNEATFAMTNVTSGDLIISPTIVVNNTTYNVTSVAGYSCMNNTGITSVTIPDGVAVIGDNAFYGCTGVKSLSLGKDIGCISNMAFAYIGTSASARNRASSDPLIIECHAASIPEAQNDSFEGIDMENAILKVNDDLVDAYKNLYPWSQFTNIVGFNAPTGINSVYSEKNGDSIFSIDGRKIDNPKKGMNIIRTSQGTRKVMVK